MKKYIALTAVPILLAIYFFSGAVYSFDDSGFTYFLPLEWDTIMRYRLLADLNRWLYTLYLPFLRICRTGIFLADDPTLFISHQELCLQSPCYEQVCLSLKIAFSTVSILIFFCFFLLFRSVRSHGFLLYVPMAVSLGYGFFWFLARFHHSEALQLFFFYLLLGMFWSCVSQGVYRLLVLLERNVPRIDTDSVSSGKR